MLSRPEYEEVLQMRRDVATLRADLKRTISEYYVRKYSPNQPRVPAGSREGGQWTADGGVSVPSAGDRSHIDAISPSRVRLADPGSTTNPIVMSDASPDPIIPGAQYAQVSVVRNDKTGDPQIDRTTETLMQSLARSHASVGEGSGAAYGILVHGTFGSDVKNQNLPGIGRVGVEQSFNLGDIARYGLDGSIRTDVVMRDPNSPSGRPIAVWDVKTGDARLSGPRVREIRDQVRVGPEVPVIELHVKRGISNKALGGGSHSVAVISVQVWDSHLPNNWDQMVIH